MKAQILTTLIGIVLILTGCNENDFGKSYNKAQVGDEIVFGGISGYGDESRTVYGDKGNNGTEIKWYEGDKVRIYSSQARPVGTNQYCDYLVTQYVDSIGGNIEYTTNPEDETFDDTHQSGLLPVSDEPYGLQWGLDGNHTFFGVYPSPDMYKDETIVFNQYSLSSEVVNGVEVGKLTAYLPTTQNPKKYVAAEEFTNSDGTTKNKHYTIHPSMRYAYMVAKSAATPAHKSVSLTFNPIVAAVEITMVNNTYTTNETTPAAIEDISAIVVSSASPIAGKFTTTIDGSVNTTAVTETAKQVRVDIQDEGGYPISLNPGDKLTFTVFLLPNNGTNDIDLSSLSFTIETGFDTRTATLTASSNMNNGILVNAKKKNFINNVNLKWNVNTNVNNWMARISQDTQIGTLSIPAAGGVGSENLDETSREQTLGIGDLWDRGIRCFELSVDGNEGSSIGGMSLVCNGQNGSITLNQAVTQITDSIINNPSEYAIVIVGFQSISDGGNCGRNAADWMKGMVTYWNTVNAADFNSSKFNGVSKTANISSGTVNVTMGTAMYNPAMKMSEARGKLFCISRPTAIGFDGWWYSVYSNPQNVLPVLGWGPSPDKFYQRGYTKNNRPVLLGRKKEVKKNVGSDLETELDDEITESEINTLKSWGRGTNYLYPYYEYTTDTNLTTDDKSDHLKDILGSANNKFMYRTCKDILTTSALANGAANTTVFDPNLKIYAQEWRRIAKTDLSFSHVKTFSFFGHEEHFTHRYYWRESLSEKKDDILAALLTATTATDYTNTIYINSLCGFYINAEENSYKPTTQVLRFYAGTSNDTGEEGFEDMRYPDYFYTILGSDNSNQNSYGFKGGTVGNIVDCANDLNDFFYDYLKSLGSRNLSGSTGIVLMDRISKTKLQADGVTKDPGYYLPQIIISNNFVDKVTTNASSLSLTVNSSTEVEEARSR